MLGSLPFFRKRVTGLFGPVPDRVNMLSAATVVQWYTAPAVAGNPTVLYTGGFALPADDLADWTPAKVNDIDGPIAYTGINTVSIGSTTAGPFGGTGTKIVTVNDSNSLQRSVYAGYKAAGPEGNPNDGDRAMLLRYAAVAKAAEITRVSLYLATHLKFEANTNSGVRATFDLANGVVAVAPHVVGATHADHITTWIAGDAHIEHLEDGWYLMWMEATCPRVNAGPVGNHTHVVTYFCMDGGSGMGAETSLINGNGTTGVYVYRANVLPSAAWAIHQHNLFDDYDDSSVFDLDNTQEPGYRWYVDPRWPTLGDSGGRIPTASIVISGSELSQTGSDTRGFLGSATYTGPRSPGAGYSPGPESGPLDTVVGKTYPLPLFVEGSVRTTLLNNFSEAGGITQPLLWSLTVDALLGQATSGAIEGDYYEFPFGQLLAYDGSGNFIGTRFLRPFGVGDNWGNAIDWTVYHRVSNIWLPASGGHEGFAAAFTNGVMTGFTNTTTPFDVSDGHSMLIWIGGRSCHHDWTSLWGAEPIVWNDEPYPGT